MSVRNSEFLARFLVLLLPLALLAARPAAAQAGGIRGFVVDPLNRPVAGAEVRAVSGPDAGRAVVTAVDGSYELAGLSPGLYRFEAAREGFAPSSLSFTVPAGTVGRLDFVLIPEGGLSAGVIRGRVIRRDTFEALGGAVVELSGPEGTARQTTTAGGFYQFAELSPGRYDLRVSRPGFAPQARSGLSVQVGEITEVLFSLRIRPADLAVLTGTVRDLEGNPIAGATVSVVRNGTRIETTRANRRGEYRLARIVPGTYLVEFFAPGYTTALARDVMLGARQRLSVDATLAPLGPTTAVVEGFVTDQSGEAVPGARVDVTEGPVSGPLDFADATGFYRIRNLLPGRYILTAKASGFAPQPLAVDLEAEKTARLDFALARDVAARTGAICGTVTAGGGQPLAGARVRILTGPTFGQTTVTDSDGDYCLEDLPSGSYRVEYSRPGYRAWTESGILVAPGQTTVQNVSLEPATGPGRIQGTVRNAGSTALDGVLVEVTGPAGVVESAGTVNGRYAIEEIPPGLYTVSYSATGYRPLVLEGIEVPEDGTVLLDVNLVAEAEPLGAISGSVRDTVGRPVPNAAVELGGPSGPRRTTTGSDGQFAFTGLVPGRDYTVRVSRGGMIPAARSGIVVRPNAAARLTFTLRLAPGRGTISGVVRRANGLPLSGATVSLASGPQAGETVQTGPDGRFNLPGLVPGEYLLQVNAPGYETLSSTVVVRQGQRTTSVFMLQLE